MAKPGREQIFVSEPIKPIVATANARAMAAGGPGLPKEFVWRGEKLGIASVLRTWRETGQCSHGSSEAYVRKHWHEVKTNSGKEAKIYFLRQARGRKKVERWWLYTIGDAQ